MAGSIYKTELTSGGVRWVLMWRDPTGRQHKKRFKRRAEAAAFLTEREKEKLDGTWREVQPAPLEEVFEAWLSDLETRVLLGEIKPSTAAGYRCGVRGFISDFGHYRSDQLSPQALARWRAREVERVAAGEIKPKSFNNGYALLHSIFAWAREPAQAFMKHDPLDGIKRIKISAEERRLSERDFLETADIAALLAVVETAEETAVVHLALFCGLRRGEIFALQWGDIEPGEGEGAGGLLHVRRALSAGKVTGPKTGNSLRVVDAAPDVLTALDRQREANSPMDGGYVFRTPIGTPHDPDNWTKRVWTPLRRRAKLRATIGLHSLRHTFASLLIEQGENPKYVSRQLGHSSPAFTLQVYAHCFRETSERAMGRLQGTIRAAKRRRFGVVANPAKGRRHA